MAVAASACGEGEREPRRGENRKEWLHDATPYQDPSQPRGREECHCPRAMSGADHVAKRRRPGAKCSSFAGHVARSTRCRAARGGPRPRAVRAERVSGECPRTSADSSRARTIGATAGAGARSRATSGRHSPPRRRRPLAPHELTAAELKRRIARPARAAPRRSSSPCSSRAACKPSTSRSRTRARRPCPSLRRRRRRSPRRSGPR